jgi:hypothetical protein
MNKLAVQTKIAKGTKRAGDFYERPNPGKL